MLNLKKILFLLLALAINRHVWGQKNIVCTSPTAEQVLQGKYDPSVYFPPKILNRPDTIANALNKLINSDTLHFYLTQLGTFYNRNTSSDTNSNTRGIGAARRWVYGKFKEYSSKNFNRLLPSYLQFDSTICTLKRHREPFAVLPGLDTTDHSVVIIESHLDSRCSDVCDTSCLAQGIDDNGSGTALVLELARIFSKYAFNHTIVFLTTVGEEQGLDGSVAFSEYAIQKGISIKAVLNNDIVSGIICGHTSSPPSCPGFGDIDSTHIRLFSYGGFNSLHKGLARFIKLEYNEELLPSAKVPMTILVMTPEDRTGRGGDHIPFRLHNFTAMRFTSANENGNANVTDSTYIDDQHTSRDIMGYDTNNDGAIDSFLVDFHYLARNTAINGIAASMAAIGPKTPGFTLIQNGSQLTITITGQTQYKQYRIGLRTVTYDWDTLYTINATIATLNGIPGNVNYVSVASVDSNGVESLFSGEQLANITGINDPANAKGIYLLPNKPNPADDATMISVLVEQTVSYKVASIRILDLKGVQLKELPVQLNKGLNEVLYKHTFHLNGTFIYQLVIDGTVIESKKMIFQNP